MKFSKSKQTKNSGVEWIGKIPECWNVWKVSHAFNIIGSGTTPKTDQLEYFNGDVPWVTTSELRETVITDTKEKITDLAISKYSTLKKYPVGTLLIAMYGATIGRLGILGIEATLNQACCAFADSKVINTKFFYYWLIFYRPILISLSSGGGQPNLNQEELRSLKVPIPSFSEQKAIAEMLNRETARLDELIAEKEHLLELLAEKRRALITHAVTRGINSKAKLVDSGIGWIGKTPEHWKTPPVYARYDVQLGKMLDEKQIKGNQLRKYLRNIDVQWGKINIENLPEMDFDFDDRKKFSLKFGDILICEGGEIGRTAIWKYDFENFYFQKALHRLRPKSKYDLPDYFLYVMHALVDLGVFISMSTASTIHHLPAEKLKIVRYPLPPIEEQQQIADYIEAETNKIDRLQKVTKLTVQLLKERRASLITAAVTGKMRVEETK